MNEEMIFRQIDLTRQSTLEEMEGLSEEQADRMPEGFRNTVRWNLGHIYTVQTLLISEFCGESIAIPTHFFGLFAPGTKPADWQGDVPTMDELGKLLKEQPEKIKEALGGQLDKEAEKPFNSLSTIGEILNFTMYHEGLHLGAIKGIEKANSVTE